MTSSTKSKWLAAMVGALLLAVFLIYIAQYGYQFGRFLAGN